MGRSGLFAERLAALEARLARLEARQPGAAGIDSLGAPLNPQEWPALREAVKEAIADLGLEEAARRYGASPETVRDLVYRTREPGAGTRARLSVLIGGRSVDLPDSS